MDAPRPAWSLSPVLGLLTAVSALAALAAADYRWEPDWTARAVGLVGSAALACLVGWSVGRSGTGRRVAPAVAVAVAVVGALGFVGVLGGPAAGPFWRDSVLRALLVSDAPYTAVAVTPLSVVVEPGNDVRVVVGLTGRPRESVRLLTRNEATPDAPWTETPMGPSPGGAGAGFGDRREATLRDLQAPLSYRVVAGPESSPQYHVNVRPPLRLQDFEVLLTPPASPAAAAAAPSAAPAPMPVTVAGGDLVAMPGSSAVFRLHFDDPTTTGTLTLTGGDSPNAVGRVVSLLAAEPGWLVSTPLPLDGVSSYAVYVHARCGSKFRSAPYRVDLR